MTDEQKSQKWWQTAPGLLSATAGLITAATGMIVALHQVGFFDKDSGHAPQAPNGSLAQPKTVQPVAAPDTVPIDPARLSLKFQAAYLTFGS